MNFTNRFLTIRAVSEMIAAEASSLILSPRYKMTLVNTRTVIMRTTTTSRRNLRRIFWGLLINDLNDKKDLMGKKYNQSRSEWKVRREILRGKHGEHKLSVCWSLIAHHHNFSVISFTKHNSLDKLHISNIATFKTHCSKSLAATLQYSSTNL